MSEDGPRRSFRQDRGATPPGTVRAAIAALFCAAAQATPAAAEELPRIEPLADCFVEPSGPLTAGVSFDCGYLVMPEDRTRPEGRTVKLGFLRASTGAGKTASPLFMIAGGPGDTLIQPSMFYLFSDTFLGPLLADRDILVLEQRGARYSVPHLDCPEIEAFGWTAVEQRLDAQATADLKAQAIPVCARRAAANGIDLAQYNVLSIVADIDAARLAFGHDRIMVYGASYGAQIGQHMLRDRPEVLEAVVLDGANALSATSWVQDRVRDADDALNQLDALCEADAKCAAAYDIRAMVDAGMAVFEAGPIAASVPDPADPTKSLDFQITDEDFAGLIFSLQTGQTSLRAMPAFLTQLVADGRNSVAAMLGEMVGQSLLAARDPAPQGSAGLLHAAVVCSDDPVTAPTDMEVPPEASAYAKALGQSILASYRRVCAGVDVPVLPPSSDADATSDVPTLVLAGALDARTPLFRSAEVARNLPRATLAVFPEGSHVQLGEVNACAAGIMRAFLGDPAAKPDLGCIETLPKRGFILPDGTNSTEAGE